MTAPGLALARFLTGIGYGCALGVLYGFLRPVRRGLAIVPDLVFVGFAGWAYLHYGFAVCRGDLRMGYLAAPCIGVFLWEFSFGRLLRPVFRGFWKILGLMMRPGVLFLKKTKKIAKFLFASAKKSVTIKRTKKSPKSPVIAGARSDRGDP